MLNHKPEISRKAQTRLRKAICGLGSIGLLLTPLSAGASQDLFCTVDGPVFGDYKIDVKKESSILGMHGGLTHVMSNGKLKMHKNSLIDGHVTAKKIKMKDKDNEDDSVITGNIVKAAAGIVPADATSLVAAFEHNNDNHLVPLTALGATALDQEKHKLEVKKGDRLVLPAGDYYLDTLKVKKGAVLELAGPVQIYMMKGKIDLKYGSLVGASNTALSIVIADKGQVKVGGHSGFHAALYAPDSKFDLKGEGVASGSLVVNKMKLDKGAEFHAMDVCVSGPPELTEVVSPPPLFDYWIGEDGYWVGTDGRVYDDQGNWLD